ncbi:hypothetical protein [Pantoea phage LIMEzero]|uniref:Uncharacterized protein n=1 Tax=Pantoea phage LIMEzero TaxID=943335 RepID=F4N9Q9_9CAUD|nr:hypothetical protein LIMEzero_ORF06 [Pantoea phage LIMEzero]CBY88537.1 hypothetical protein [Pantoea phage LIMEzero]
MTIIRFFFSETEQDIIATLDGGETPTVGDNAICFDGTQTTGPFGSDRPLAVQGAESYAAQGVPSKVLPFLLHGGALNSVLEGYELVYTDEFDA